MLGPYSSGLTSAIAPITEKYKIPMVESEGTSLSLFNKGYKYLFAVVSTSEEYLTGAVALAAERAKRQGRRPQDVKISMAFEGGIFSQNVRAGAVQAAKRHGLRIVIDDKLPRDLSDMSLTLSKVQAQNPDLLLVSGYSKGAVTAARQIGELNINVPMIAMTHCETSDIINKFGSSVDGVLCPTQWAETLPHHGPTFGSAMDYSKTFKKVYDGYDKSVPYQAAQASAAVLVWKDAFERAQSFDTEKVRNALAATNMETFYGGIKFSQSGNNIGKSMLMREIRNGNFVATALQCAKGTCACAGSNACSKGCCNSQSTNTLSILR